MARPSAPRATYPLQLSRDFGFAGAETVAPYLAALGIISHAYLSPILKARRGSVRGYDVVDHTTLNPELGSASDFERPGADCRRHGNGIVMTGKLEAGWDTARRIQQFTGPVMAKGSEDTSLYRYNRLIALSDVGEKPDQFGTSVEAFHDWAAARASEAANGLLVDVRQRGLFADLPVSVLTNVPPRDATVAHGSRCNHLPPMALFSVQLHHWQKAEKCTG